MSGQDQQDQARPPRLVKGPPPKQGPLKATMPLSTVTKRGSDLGKSTSPSGQGCWRAKTEYLGQRSPGSSVASKGKSRLCNKSNVIRRAASLDAIYLNGLFPRDGFLLQRDRATQTDISNSLDSLQISTKSMEDNLGKLTMRQRKRSTSRESNPRHLSPTADQNNAATTTTTTTSSSQTTTSSFSPSNKARSSEEGLNQEIERIIKSESDPQCSDRVREPTPEGRKAPIADILLRGRNTDSSQILLTTPDQQQQRHDNSPHINKFLSREPPDGCERVSLMKTSVNPIVKPIPIEPQRTFFQLKPSSHSAFESLTTTTRSNESDDPKDDSPKVPNQPQQQ